MSTDNAENTENTEKKESTASSADKAAEREARRAEREAEKRAQRQERLIRGYRNITLDEGQDKLASQLYLNNKGSQFFSKPFNFDKKSLFLKSNDGKLHFDVDSITGGHQDLINKLDDVVRVLVLQDEKFWRLDV